MRTVVPLVLTLLIAGFGAWILIAGDGASEPGGDFKTSEPGEDAAPVPLESSPSMEGRDRPPVTRGSRGRSIDPRTIPRGRIDVLPVGPDLQPLPSGLLHVYVDPTGGRAWSRQLGLRNLETGVWSWPRMLAGEVEIHLFGDHVREVKKRAIVKADSQLEVTVHVDLAGAIKYDVLLPDKKRPERVTVTLFDADDVPFEAIFQARGSRFRTSPLRARSAVLGPEGVVFDLPKGRYRLRVESTSGAYQDLVADIEVGRTLPLTFQLSG